MSSTTRLKTPALLPDTLSALEGLRVGQCLASPVTLLQENKTESAGTHHDLPGGRGKEGGLKTMHIVLYYQLKVCFYIKN